MPGLCSLAWMTAGGSICCRGGSHSAGMCKTDTNLLLVQLAATGLDKLNDITVRHNPSMPDSARVTSGYKANQKNTFHQLAEINSLFGAGVSPLQTMWCSCSPHL